MRAILFFILLAISVNAQTITNLEVAATATSSSTQSVLTLPRFAFDGNNGTIWCSDLFTNNAVVTVASLYDDLGATCIVTGVKIVWEQYSAAKAFSVQISKDNQVWLPVWSTLTNTSMVNNISGLTVTGRYFQIKMDNRLGSYGFAVTNVSILGYALTLPASPPTPTNLTIWATPFASTRTKQYFNPPLSITNAGSTLSITGVQWRAYSSAVSSNPPLPGSDYAAVQFKYAGPSRAFQWEGLSNGIVIALSPPVTITNGSSGEITDFITNSISQRRARLLP